MTPSNLKELSLFSFYCFRGGIDKLYSVSFLYFPVIGTLTTVCVGVVISLATGNFCKSTTVFLSGFGSSVYQLLYT